MKREDVLKMYTRYAPHYNELWHTDGPWAKETGYHLETLGELVGPETYWLDAGCGTGYFLSKFPGVRRVGLDLTPAMLEQARIGSTDAEELREGDLRDDIEEWHDRFDLVTSTGQAWNYVDTLDEIEQIAENLARWTAPDGKCFVQVVDIMDLVDCEVTYNFTGIRSGYETFVTGVVGSTYDGDQLHTNLLYPSLDQWVQWFSRHFTRIEIIRWPHDPGYPVVRVPRRSVLASGKRASGDTTPTEIIEHPVPAVVADASAARPEAGEAAADEEAAPGPTTSSAPSAAPRPAEPGERLPDRGLVDQPLSYLISRIRPADPRFWRSGIRRVGRRLRRGR